MPRMKSMTGFGRGEMTDDGRTCRAEISSVNRRQLDVVVHLPRALTALERPVRRFIHDRLSRGRVTAKIALHSEQTALGILRVDKVLAGQYAEHFRELEQTLSVRLAPLDLSRLPGVFEIEESAMEVEADWPIIERTLEEAFKGFAHMRQEEGEHLRAVLTESRDLVSDLLAAMRERAPQVVRNHREALHRRLEEAGLPISLDDERLLREIGLFADRCEISEELDRLHSHLKQMTSYLNDTDPVGRPLDFLAQEMNREFNTIGAKASDADLAQLVVRGKTEVEKIREQVQNIE